MTLISDAVSNAVPSSIAISAPERDPLTYGRLNELLESIATHLNDQGIGRNDRVAIVLPNGPEMASSFLAVASCATAAPLNPAYRKDEFAFYLEDLEAACVIVEAGRCDS